jgi:hypothetical protein
MFRRDLLSALCAVPVMSTAGQLFAQGAAGRLLVIVHPNNAAQLSVADLRAIFLTRRVDWPNGERIIAFNYPARHPVRVAFDQAVLGMNPDEVARYWIDRRVRGGNRPPKQVPNANLMTRVVERLEGAIGYVTDDLDTRNVRVIGSVVGDKIELTSNG